MEYRKASHTVYNIQYHFVRVTKYRYHVLAGEVKLRVGRLSVKYVSDTIF